ncbi:hypothetical protein, partial [Pseudomonas syringae]|uniref:hypothetical protein n=1 Tax=Pseudomonas syringae TaxID=317 RepID=UPI0034D647EA
IWGFKCIKKYNNGTMIWQFSAIAQMKRDVTMEVLFQIFIYLFISRISTPSFSTPKWGLRVAYKRHNSMPTQQ